MNIPIAIIGVLSVIAGSWLWFIREEPSDGLGSGLAVGIGLLLIYTACK